MYLRSLDENIFDGNKLDNYILSKQNLSLDDMQEHLRHIFHRRYFNYTKYYTINL
jgi:hypothetical protein